MSNNILHCLCRPYGEDRALPLFWLERQARPTGDILKLMVLNLNSITNSENGDSHWPCSLAVRIFDVTQARNHPDKILMVKVSRDS